MGDFPAIVFLDPMNLDGYNRSLPSCEQPPHIPVAFLEAMAVREEVFVKEQGVPLLMEADADDPRSCHWVAYDMLPGQQLATPVGTLRLVPFPHDPHPEPGSSWDIDPDGEGNKITLKGMSFIRDRPTTFHDGKEPYLKLGRWAVTKEFRGRGIAGRLVERALDWAKENSTYFNPRPGGVIKDESGATVDPSRTTWNGLVCVHAQEYLLRAWAKLGFELDPKMGKWTEAGIPHVGMFLRLEIPKE